MYYVERAVALVFLLFAFCARWRRPPRASDRERWTEMGNTQSGWRCTPRSDCADWTAGWVLSFLANAIFVVCVRAPHYIARLIAHQLPSYLSDAIVIPQFNERDLATESSSVCVSDCQEPHTKRHTNTLLNNGAAFCLPFKFQCLALRLKLKQTTRYDLF